jgi:hypothetical protein
MYRKRGFLLLEADGHGYTTTVAKTPLWSTKPGGYTGIHGGVFLTIVAKRSVAKTLLWSTKPGGYTGIHGGVFLTIVAKRSVAKNTPHGVPNPEGRPVSMGVFS